MRKLKKVILWFVVLLPWLVGAHELSGSGGFNQGLVHPVLGFDHFLAMVSVGIVSAQIGGMAIWSVPLTFVIFMALGGVLGMRDVWFSMIELGIAFSVLALGMAIVFDKRVSPIIAIGSVAFFAIFHGHAHGNEMPTLVKPYLYMCGFVSGTSLIHLLGVAIGIIAGRVNGGTQVLKYIGAGITGIGIYLIYLFIDMA